MTGAARREQILDVTKRIVGQDGLHAVSIDRVAREAGISRPIVYEHFSNLPGLLHSLLQREAARASDQLAAALRQLERSGIPPADLLLAALAAYLEAVRAEPVTWRLILTPPESVPASVRRRVEQARAAIVAQLAALVEAAPGPSGGLTTGRGWCSPTQSATQSSGSSCTRAGRSAASRADRRHRDADTPGVGSRDAAVDAARPRVSARGRR
jgi:AcrR family transcriptional regulator